MISAETIAEWQVRIRVSPRSPVDRWPASVSVAMGGRSLADLRLDRGVTTLALDILPPGRHVLDIRYAGDVFFASAHATHTIDVRWPRLHVGGMAFEEGDAGPHVVNVPVTLSEPSSARTRVAWFTVNGTARENDDFVAAGGTITFEPGETMAAIPLTINGDDVPEETETFGVAIRDPENAEIGTAFAELRIFSDDALYETHEDLAYGPRMLTLRVPTLPGPHPLIVAIDAPSWSFVTRHATGAEWLARRGYAVATVEFTPSTIAPWPRQLEDVRAAIAWLREHAAAYGLDAGAIGAIGIGAGGQLAAHLGLRDEVQAVVEWNGPVELSRLEGCGTLAGDVAMLLGCTPETCESRVRSACPTSSAAPTAVPFLLLHRETNCEVPIRQPVAFASALRAVGGNVTFFAIGSEAEAQALSMRFFDASLQTVAAKRRATR